MHKLALLSVASLLILTACGTHESTEVSVDRSIGRMIPPDTRALAGIDLASIRNTEFYKRESGRLNAAGLDLMTERLGGDPRRDLAKLVVAWDGKKLLFIVEGRFSPADLERRLIAAGAHETPYRKYKLLGDSKNSVAFLNSELAAAGPLDALEPAIDSFEDGRGALPKSLQAQMKQIPKNDQLWLASTGGLPFVEMQMRSDLESALSNIVDYVNATRAGINVGSGLHLFADVSCVSEKGAKRVHDALRGVIGFGRLSTKDKETELLRIYDSIQVNQKQETVEIRADLTGDLADALLNRLQLESNGIRRQSGAR